MPTKRIHCISHQNDRVSEKQNFQWFFTALHSTSHINKRMENHFNYNGVQLKTCANVKESLQTIMVNVLSLQRPFDFNDVKIFYAVCKWKKAMPSVIPVVQLSHPINT